MKRIILTFFAFLLSNLVSFSQEETPRPLVEQLIRLSPSPTASSLGTFVKQSDANGSTGAITKSIALASVSCGDLTYSPAINYSSTGVKVNDWGGRMGIGWKENFTAVIYRTIKSVPDENASSRIHLPESTMSEVTQTNFNRVSSIANSLSMSGVDSEYDEFTYNVFGISGSFIIKDGVAKQLNHQTGVSIEVYGTTNRSFIIRTSDGNSYHFLNVVELTSFINDDSWDNGPTVSMLSVPTAWYLTKMVSPSKHEIRFQYDTMPFPIAYFSNYVEAMTVLLKDDPHIGDDYYNPAHYNKYEFRSSLRKQESSIPVLSIIESDNFNIEFQYEDRDGIWGEKIYKRILVKDYGGKIINDIRFDYLQTMSGQNFEGNLAHLIGNQEDEKQALRRRFFLSELKISGQSTEVQKYGFTYHYPEKLPHRLSFSQDLGGYYNGKTNGYFIPQHVVEKYRQTYLNNIAPPNFLAMGNRVTDTISKAGLLKSVIFPTKGFETIEYGLNVETKDVVITDVVELKDTMRHSGSSHYTEFGTEREPMWINTGNVIIDVRPKFTGELAEWEYEISMVDFALYNISEEQFVALPGAGPDGYVSRIVLDNYYESVYLQGGEYNWLMRLHRNKTYVETRIAAFENRTEVKDVPLYGNRVEKIESFSSAGVRENTRIFDYKKFSVTDGKITHSDRSSLNIYSLLVPGFAFRSTLYYHYPDFPPPQFPVIIDPAGVAERIYHNFTSYDQSDLAAFSGFSYSYEQVTEYIDANKKGFNAITYFMHPSGEGSGEIISANLPSFSPLSNSGWKNGLVSRSYAGEVLNGHAFVRAETRNYYSTGSGLELYDNYVVRKLFNAVDTWSYPEENFRQYAIYHYQLGNRWYKLDSVQTTNYHIQTNLSNTIRYAYNPHNKLLSSEWSIDSKGTKTTKSYKRPSDMVSMGEDPGGVYGAMVEGYYHAPVTEEKIVTGNNKLVSLIKNQYSQVSTGVFRPLTSQHFDSNGNASRQISFDLYDDKFNLVSYKDEQIPYQILWGYKSQYPIAKIENATYADIVSVLGMPAINSLNSLTISTAAIRSTLQSLRSHPTMRKAKVSSYTYKPLLGMTSMTDSRGITEHYEYDGSNRLSLIRDNDGNIVKSYCYNYQGQQVDCNDNTPAVYYNTYKIQSFTKNDCISGTGSLVAYSIAAGVYSSTVSQAHADSLAMAQVIAQGQSHANANGYCSTGKPYVKMCANPHPEQVLSETATEKIVLIKGDVGMQFYGNAEMSGPYQFSEEVYGASVNYRIETQPGMQIPDHPAVFEGTWFGEEFENIYFYEIPLSKKVFKKVSGIWVLDYQIDNVFMALPSTEYFIIN